MKSFAVTAAALVACAVLLMACRPQPAPTPTLPPSPTPRPLFTPSPLATPDPGRLAEPGSREALLAAVPALAERERRFAEALASDQPVLLYGGELDAQQQQAQAIAVADPTVRSFVFDRLTGAPLRSEVMMVRPALPSDLSGEAAQRCAGQTCYRVEIYNYAANATIVALANLDRGSVVSVLYYPETQPELPPYLGELAAQIAVHSPEVAEQLGFRPGVDRAGMPSVKTALNNSQCERSRHLCVGPTFILPGQGRALWAIVDLTEGRLVGTRWTDTGQGEGAPVTEQGLQDAVVMATYCEQSQRLSRDGWELSYQLTSSDGLEVRDVTFQGRPVLRSAKLVDWHVSYSTDQGFGYSDATGCPMFSTASVVAFSGPTVGEIEQEGQAVGFVLEQDFRSEQWPLPCNYRYVHTFEFYRDGRFRVGGRNLGRGCGNQGTYRPVLRIHLTPGAFDGRVDVAEWGGSEWTPWTEEGWVKQDEATAYTAEGFQFRFLGEDGRGYYLEPNRGQFGDGSRGDNAHVYITAYKPEEGDADLLTIGPCCNTDYRQGPEKFLEPPEPLADGVVVWYVPELKNDDTPGNEYCWAESYVAAGLVRYRVFPCAFGPMFVPAP